MAGSATRQPPPLPRLIATGHARANVSKLEDVSIYHLLISVTLR